MFAIQKKTGIITGLALLLTGALWLGLNRRTAISPSGPPPDNASEQCLPVQQTGQPISGGSSRKSASTMSKFLKREAGKTPVRKLTPQESADIEEAQEVCAELMDALDDDTSAILAKARVLINHPNPEVRQQVLDALDWVGSDALYDLANMLDDENGAIAKAATESFWEQVEDLPNDQAKLKLLESFSNSQDPDMLSHLAEELSNYHPHMAYDLILSILSASPNTVHEDLQWELEGITGESFETTPEWQKWFIENKSILEADYKDQDF